MQSEVIAERMNREDPNSTEIPISTPSESPPDAAESEAKTSGAPPPNANNVTPDRLSDNLNVLAMHWRAGLKYSSAVKLRT